MQSMDRISILPDYDIPRIICGGWQLSTGHALKQALDMADAKRDQIPKGRLQVLQ